MNDKTHRVTLSLLEKDYQVACQAEEKPALLKAAEELERRMRRTRLQQGVVGAERIAVLVALNLCYELHQMQNAQDSFSGSEALQQLLDKVEAALLGEAPK
jgi:cell division protein ZapA